MPELANITPSTDSERNRQLIELVRKYPNLIGALIHFSDPAISTNEEEAMTHTMTTRPISEVGNEIDPRFVFMESEDIEWQELISAIDNAHLWVLENKPSYVNNSFRRSFLPRLLEDLQNLFNIINRKAVNKPNKIDLLIARPKAIQKIEQKGLAQFDQRHTKKQTEILTAIIAEGSEKAYDINSITDLLIKKIDEITEEVFKEVLMLFPEGSLVLQRADKEIEFEEIQGQLKLRNPKILLREDIKKLQLRKVINDTDETGTISVFYVEGNDGHKYLIADLNQNFEGGNYRVIASTEELPNTNTSIYAITNSLVFTTEEVLKTIRDCIKSGQFELAKYHLDSFLNDPFQQIETQLPAINIQSDSFDLEDLIIWYILIRGDKNYLNDRELYALQNNLPDSTELIRRYAPYMIRKKRMSGNYDQKDRLKHISTIGTDSDINTISNTTRSEIEKKEKEIDFHIHNPNKRTIGPLILCNYSSNGINNFEEYISFSKDSKDISLKSTKPLKVLNGGVLPLILERFARINQIILKDHKGEIIDNSNYKILYNSNTGEYLVEFKNIKIDSCWIEIDYHQETYKIPGNLDLDTSKVQELAYHLKTEGFEKFADTLLAQIEDLYPSAITAQDLGIISGLIGKYSYRSQSSSIDPNNVLDTLRKFLKKTTLFAQCDAFATLIKYCFDYIFRNDPNVEIKISTCYMIADNRESISINESILHARVDIIKHGKLIATVDGTPSSEEILSTSEQSVKRIKIDSNNFIKNKIDSLFIKLKTLLDLSEEGRKYLNNTNTFKDDPIAQLLRILFRLSEDHRNFNEEKKKIIQIKALFESGKQIIEVKSRIDGMPIYSKDLISELIKMCKEIIGL